MAHRVFDVWVHFAEGFAHAVRNEDWIVAEAFGATRGNTNWPFTSPSKISLSPPGSASANAQTNFAE